MTKDEHRMVGWWLIWALMGGLLIGVSASAIRRAPLAEERNQLKKQVEVLTDLVLESKLRTGNEDDEDDS